jgi:DNA-binding transcriptional LysR family regulator
LFDRSRRSVTLTPSGKELLAAARELLDLWADGVRSATAADRLDVSLRIGLQTALGRGLATVLGERYGRGLAFRQFSWTDPTAGLAGGEADAAFVWLPLPDAGRFRWHVIRTERRWVLMPAAHPLAQRPTVMLADLQDEPFVALPAEAGVLRSYWLADDERDRPATVAAEASGPDEKVEAVAAGAGLCLVAEGNVELYRRPGLAARPVTGLSPARLAIAWAANDTRERLHRLIRLVSEAHSGG